MLGNFLNATNHKGNAQGFKVNSINKLVDTKSSQSSNRTLLHFVAKTVTQTMPKTELFLEELHKPADAFKGKQDVGRALPAPVLTQCLSTADLSHVRAALIDFATQQESLDNLLNTHFDDLSSLHPDDGFPKKMFRFRREAEDRLAALKDSLRLADSTYNQALTFYGEDAKSIASTDEFFSVFKTFVSSYKTAREDNRRAEEARIKAEQAAARKAEAAAAAAAALQSGDSLVEDMLKTLREQSLDTPRAVRRAGRKNLLAGGSSSGKESPSALLFDRSGATSPTPDGLGSSGGSSSSRVDGLDDLLASGQELMARLTGEGVRSFLSSACIVCPALRRYLRSSPPLHPHQPPLPSQLAAPEPATLAGQPAKTYSLPSLRMSHPHPCRPTP